MGNTRWDEVKARLRKDPVVRCQDIFDDVRRSGEQLVTLAITIGQKIEAGPDGELGWKPGTLEEGRALELLTRNGIVVSTGRYDASAHASVRKVEEYKEK